MTIWARLFLQRQQVVFWGCLWLIFVATEVASLCDLCHEEGFECSSNYFPCFRDCCLVGAMFCDPSSEVRTCRWCDERKVLCGNSSMPVECLLFCHQLQQAGEASPAPCFSTEVIVVSAVCLVLATVCITSSTIGLCCWLRLRAKRKQEEDSECLIKDTREEDMELQSPTVQTSTSMDVDVNHTDRPACQRPASPLPASATSSIQTVDGELMHTSFREEPDQAESWHPSSTTPPSSDASLSSSPATAARFEKDPADANARVDRTPRAVSQPTEDAENNDFAGPEKDAARRLARLDPGSSVHDETAQPASPARKPSCGYTSSEPTVTQREPRLQVLSSCPESNSSEEKHIAIAVQNTVDYKVS